MYSGAQDKYIGTRLVWHTSSWHVAHCCAGAGPLGPFVQVPIPPGGPEQMGMGPQMGAGMPRGGSRGPIPRVPRTQSGGGRGGYGGGPMPMGGRGYAGRGGYFDLDAPENQRGVLDYGDL